MKKYHIYYRQREMQQILCYNDKEALGKALVWYDRKCTDNKKHISNLQVRTPEGQMLAVKR